MKFIRFGGLSAVSYPKWTKGERIIDGLIFSKFHHPPKRKGIYAFIYPYSDPFMWAWKIKSEEEYKKTYKKLKRVFEYEGYLWSHLNNKTSNKKGSWYKIHTSELQNILNKETHADIKLILSGNNINLGKVKNPYKRGLGGNVSIDHLEVFIEKKNLGKIR